MFLPATASPPKARRGPSEPIRPLGSARLGRRLADAARKTGRALHDEHPEVRAFAEEERGRRSAAQGTADNHDIVLHAR